MEATLLPSTPLEPADVADYQEELMLWQESLLQQAFARLKHGIGSTMTAEFE